MSNSMQQPSIPQQQQPAFTSRWRAGQPRQPRFPPPPPPPVQQQPYYPPIAGHLAQTTAAPPSFPPPSYIKHSSANENRVKLTGEAASLSDLSGASNMPHVSMVLLNKSLGQCSVRLSFPPASFLLRGKG